MSGQDQDAQPSLNAPGESGPSGIVATPDHGRDLAEEPLAPDPLPCSICGALVGSGDAARHTDWHERLVDEVVSAVKVRLSDPPGGV